MTDKTPNNHIYIRNMVCGRCITAVTQVLQETGIDYRSILLGEVLVKEPVTEAQKELLRDKLASAGFMLLDDEKSRLIEKIKNIIIELVHYNNADSRYNLSTVLAEKLLRDYSSLSRLFSEVEGITIEKYAINQKIEKIKELLVYNEMSLGDIAFQLGYSSVAHLSAQFKKVTGLTPSYFKQHRGVARKALDNI